MGTTTSPMRPEAPLGRSQPRPSLKPFLLLHLCCGPCATHAIESLKFSYRTVGLFYNPNLHPRDEFYRRLEAASAVCRASGIPLWTLPPDPSLWFQAIRGTEDEPEGGARCRLCFSLRLETTARIASGASFDLFATTLSTSPHKKAAVIHAVGEHWARVQGVRYLSVDFKKRNGYRRSVEISKKLGLYRQRYCGCRFSNRGTPSNGPICL